MLIKTKRVTVNVVDPASLYAEVGKLLKAARESAGLTQEQMAMRLGMTRTNWTNIEAGRGAIMLVHIYNVALVTGLPMRRLLPKC